MEVARSGDFSHVSDYLAEDVQFSVSIAVRSPTRKELHGRESVIAHLRNLDGRDSSKIDEAVDVFAGGERIVATRNVIVAVGANTSLRNECTLVFDVRDGLIRRLALHHELSNAAESRSTASPPARGRNRGADALSTVSAVDA